MRVNLLTLRSSRRVLGVAGTAIAAVLALAAPAMAHTPIMLTSQDVVPWTSPLVVDGTDPVALFGELPHCASVRSAQFNMQAGQEINLSYGVPDEAPENQMPLSSMPTIVLIAPDYKVTVLRADTSQPTVPEDGFQFIFVNNYSATAEAGTYSLMVIGGCAPLRFVVSLGLDPGDFDGVDRGSVATFDQFISWYTTPVTGDATALGPRPR